MPSIEDFIKARLEEMSREEPWGLEEFVQGFICSTLEILELHRQWPVLVKKTPEPAVVYNQLSTDSVIMQMTEKINWLTRQEYFERFGEEAGTTPILRSIACIWRTHPDFNPDWV
jgi:hypothetical protein